MGSAALLLAGITIWQLAPEPNVQTMEDSIVDPTGNSEKPTPQAHIPSPRETPPPLPPIETLPMANDLAATLNRPDEAPETQLQAVEQVLYLFRQGLGENPVGQNEDIVAALLGDNPKRAAYLPNNSPAIKEGKLVDQWGSPYWFHPVSANFMEIRSAGPDRELFTNDDVLLDR